ncbi:DUF3097 domain-containing protein [Ralstonia pickettii]|uniref:DUF3097 domain-containing protein n=1 Tax=Ralstonia pickettii TaxID=329 RepID=UPI0021563097
MTRQSLERGDIAGFLSVAVLPNLVWIVVPFAVIVVLGLIVSVATFWKTVLYFLVEGRHDAELVEKVWGHDLRVDGVVVEYLEGVDHLDGFSNRHAADPHRDDRAIARSSRCGSAACRFENPSRWSTSSRRRVGSGSPIGRCLATRCAVRRPSSSNASIARYGSRFARSPDRATRCIGGPCIRCCGSLRSVLVADTCERCGRKLRRSRSRR